MAYLAEHFNVRRSIYASLVQSMPEEKFIQFMPEEKFIPAGQFIIHLKSEHLAEINKPILDYYVPQRNSNNTALIKDELAEYISFMERKNINLILRITDLEMKMKAIEPYIPTIIKIISDYAAAETRIEVKKENLIKKFSLKKQKDIKLWAGASEEVDIADTTLDEMLGKIEE